MRDVRCYRHSVPSKLPCKMPKFVVQDESSSSSVGGHPTFVELTGLPFDECLITDTTADIGERYSRLIQGNGLLG